MLEDKTVEMLELLSSKIGVASEKIWEWALIQVKVDIINTFLFLIMSLSLIYPYIKISNFLEKKYKKDHDEFYETSHFLITIIGGIVLVCFLISSMVLITKLPSLILNPEYAAFQKIIKELSNFK